MCRLGLVTVIFVASVGIAASQTIDIGTGKGPDIKYRPILIGNGPDALINKIDTAELIKQGQQKGAVMFICLVSQTGVVTWARTYGAGGDVRFLEKELQRQLSAAANPHFIPGIYDHLPVDALYFGTVTFAVVNGKPRLRIFSNQQAEEVSKESDFIGPQPVLGGLSKFVGFEYPSIVAHRAALVDGFVQVRLNVDETGNLQGLEVIEETPPLIGFGEAAILDLRGAKFIPAFRNGTPVACDVTLPIYYKAPIF